MAAVLLWPDVTANAVFADVVLVFISDGLQFGVAVPSAVNANASIV